jgi:hypothetical protein
MERPEDYREDLMKFCSYKIGVREDIEDIVQNTYLMYYSYSSFNKENTWKCLAWILKQEISRFYKKRKLAHSLDEIEEYDDEENIGIDKILLKASQVDYNEGFLSWDKKVLLDHLEMPRRDRNRQKWKGFIPEFIRLYLVAKVRPGIISTKVQSITKTNGKYGYFKNAENRINSLSSKSKI